MKNRKAKTQWQDDIVEWKSLEISEPMRTTTNRNEWRYIFKKSTALLWNIKAMV